MMIVELIPTNRRKSFYGKAKVIIDGTASYLRSYETVIAGIDANGKLHRYSDHRSNTTSTHVKSFLEQSGIVMGTTEFWALPVEDMPRLCVTL